MYFYLVFVYFDYKIIFIGEFIVCSLNDNSNKFFTGSEVLKGAGFSATPSLRSESTISFNPGK